MYNDPNTDWMDPNLDPRELAMFQQLYPGGPNAEDDMPLEPEDGQAPATTQSAALAPAAPLSTPPPPAARLQIPTSDRAALYQQLRPYPGMSKSEKLSRLLADSFRVGAEPGTGSAIRDASRGFSSGLDSYNNLRDYDRSIQGDYAGRVLGQVGAQEEFGRKAADTQADIGKKGAEANRANAYGPYIGKTGDSRVTRANAEMIKAQAADKLADRAITPRPMVYSPGAIGVDANNNIVVDNRKKDNKDVLVKRAEEANAYLTSIMGDKHDASSQAATAKTIMESKKAPEGSVLALAMDTLNEPDPAKQKVKLDNIRKAAGIKHEFDPIKTGKGAGGGKADPLADIIQFNEWKFRGEDGKGPIDWDKMAAAAENDMLERDVTNESQKYVRPRDLVIRIQKLRRGSTSPKSGVNSGAFPAGKGGPITPNGNPADELLRQQMGEFARSIKEGVKP